MITVRDFRATTVDKVFDTAADHFEFGRYRWIQNEIEREGAYCISGALHHVAQCSRSLNSQGVCSASHWFAEKQLGVRIAVWNDTPGRTVAEVVDKLRELAKLYRDSKISTMTSKKWKMLPW